MQGTVNNFAVSSGTYGLQEALNSILGNGGVIDVTQDWLGQTSQITNATGNSKTFIHDLRSGDS
jgi:hypothetical protein